MGKKNVWWTADADPQPPLQHTLLHADSLLCRLWRTRVPDACTGGGTSLRPGLRFHQQSCRGEIRISALCPWFIKNKWEQLKVSYFTILSYHLSGMANRHKTANYESSCWISARLSAPEECLIAHIPFVWQILTSTQHQHQKQCFNSDYYLGWRSINSVTAC